MAELTYTAAEMADALGISERYLRTLVERGDAPPTLPFGRRLVFPKAGVEQWLANNASTIRKTAVRRTAA